MHINFNSTAFSLLLHMSAADTAQVAFNAFHRIFTQPKENTSQMLQLYAFGHFAETNLDVVIPWWMREWKRNASSSLIHRAKSVSIYLTFHYHPFAPFVSQRELNLHTQKFSSFLLVFFWWEKLWRNFFSFSVINLIFSFLFIFSAHFSPSVRHKSGRVELNELKKCRVARSAANLLPLRIKSARRTSSAHCWAWLRETEDASNKCHVAIHLPLCSARWNV